MDRSQEILSTLQQWGVEYQITEHEAAMTMEDLIPIEAELGVKIFRNLFLTNRQKTEFYLLLIVGDKAFRTSEVSKKLGVARLSFGDADTLLNMLGSLGNLGDVNMGSLNDAVEALSGAADTLKELDIANFNELIVSLETTAKNLEKTTSGFAGLFGR